MIKKILVVTLVLITGYSYAQEGTTSPYSFYGIGLQKFKGTVENRSMGGLSMLSDSIHLNLQNPAAYGDLRLTAYTIGTTYGKYSIENETASSSKDNATIEYLGLGIPMGKFGLGFGVIPSTAVGYDLISLEGSETERRFTGRGGLNKVYVSAGINLNENLSVGLDFNYNFGNIETKAILRNPDLERGTREINSSDLSGVGFAIGINYKSLITEKLELTASIVSRPSSKLSSDNSRELATVNVDNFGREIVFESQNISVADSDLDLPAELKIGTGIGEPKKWFVGAEFNFQDTENFSDRISGNNDNNVSYENALSYKMGGYFIPKFNSLTSYFNRVVYRAGIRYEKTGLNINNQSIDEFGISFGVGLPVGSLFSNANLGFEYGQRGRTDFGLVRENFFNFSVSLSLNDKWFRQLKFN
ncbi:hypothetical protein [Aquimarina brevivitae]|uniref:Long-subunit fatty acid transport protein n=1 Tax=Aquimarina brevivitae TaxID=323412 RepID=A0A4Q7PHB4_9FLAO|nr:hypothetical protein [Aquimarina brevivitae]RZS99785.1 long-subunit fatty acid transport protein [Aquimarina brevivitae]